MKCLILFQVASPCVSSDDDGEDEDDPSSKGEDTEEEWQAPIHVQHTIRQETKQAAAASQGPYRLLKWHLRKRPAAGPLGYLKSKLRALGRDATKEAKAVDCQSRSSDSSPRGRGAGRRKRRRVMRTVDNINVAHNGDIQQDMDNNNDKPSGVQNGQLCLGEVVVKPEPLDTGYEHSNFNLLTDNFVGNLEKAVRHIREVSPGRSCDTPERSHDMSHTAANGRPVDAIANILKLKHTLENTRQDLKSKEEENSQLESNLQIARREISQLQEQLSRRESQFSDLASEFFDLSNRFMKMSHHFKSVMTEIHGSPAGPSKR